MAAAAAICSADSRVDPLDPVLHVRREVAHQHRGDVADHAAAELRRRADSCRSSGPALVPGAPGSASRSRRCWPGRGPSRRRRWRARRPSGRLVALGDVRGPGELQPNRAHPDRDLALVLVVAEILGELGARQARGHLGDVVEELPDLLDRLSDLELVLDQHRVSLFT